MGAEKLHQLATVVEHVQPHVVFYLAGIPIRNTVVNTWIVMAVLLVFAYFVTRNLKEKPRGWQHLPELYVEFIWGLLESLMGRKGRKYLPYVGSLFAFILFLNLSWFVPTMKPPTMDLSTTAAFGVTTIIVVQILGIVDRGLRGYVKDYLSPSIILSPLNVIEEGVKPVSLSLRLFGNMFGEEMAVTILFILVPLLVPTIVQLLGVIMGFIQAFVFTLLTCTYISIRSMGHGH